MGGDSAGRGEFMKNFRIGSRQRGEGADLLIGVVLETGGGFEKNRSTGGGPHRANFTTTKDYCFSTGRQRKGEKQRGGGWGGGGVY